LRSNFDYINQTTLRFLVGRAAAVGTGFFAYASRWLKF